MNMRKIWAVMICLGILGLLGCTPSGSPPEQTQTEEPPAAEPQPVEEPEEGSASVEPIDEQDVVRLMVDANERWWHFVSSRADAEKADFQVGDIPYVYLGEDLDTREEFMAYMGKAYSRAYIESFMEMAEIVERDGKLAKPHMHTDNNADYSRATAKLLEDQGTTKIFEHRLPCCEGSIEIYQVTVVYVEDQGWRVDQIRHESEISDGTGNAG